MWRTKSSSWPHDLTQNLEIIIKSLRKSKHPGENISDELETFQSITLLLSDYSAKTRRHTRLKILEFLSENNIKTYEITVSYRQKILGG